MIMWIAAIVLVAVMVSIGYRQGAIRAAFTFVGLLLAAALAFPMAPLFNFIFNFINVHPAVPPFVTPIIAFLVVSIAMSIAGAFVFRKVDYHYRYHVPDAFRAFWERMHRRVGAAIGALNGMIYFIVFALAVAVPGYFAMQAGGEESGSKVMWFVSKAAQDLQSTKMDKVVAPFNPAPAKYYEVSDIVGLLYHNRGLRERLYNYPVFAAMAERPIFKSLGADKDVQQMIDSGAPLKDLLANEKLREVSTNAELYAEFMAVDLKDLRQYLETGVSPKFSEEKILGRWAYDMHTSLQLNKRAQPDVPASSWFRMKNELRERFKDSLFTAFYDNKAKFELSAEMEGKSSPTIAVPVPNTRNQTNFIPLWLNATASHSASGKWSGAAPNYRVELSNQNGRNASDVRMDGNTKLSFVFEGKHVAFERVAD